MKRIFVTAQIEQVKDSKFTLVQIVSEPDDSGISFWKSFIFIRDPV
jgi:hypothetical protein